MFRIATLNKIASVGLEKFTELYEITDGENGLDDVTGVLVRSQAMHDYDFPESLLAIARAGAGVNNIPIEKCSDEGIVVFNTPGANANSVKELILGSMIMSARNMAEAIQWTNSLKDDPTIEDISKAVEKGKSKFAGHEIQGKTLAVLGLGAIGALVANSAVGLGMNVVGYDPYLSDAARERLSFDVTILSTPELAVANADFVTLHIPAMDSTTGMINKDLLSEFKDGSTLLNFSRDKLVVEDAIIEALESGKLGKYITDFATRGIFGIPGVTITPHLGASTEEAEDNCAIMASEELMDYVENGNIKNSVNFPALRMEEDYPTKVTILTKNEPHPEKLLAAMFADKNVDEVIGATRGEYGYAILGTSDEITEVPEIDEVIRIRVITRD